MIEYINKRLIDWATWSKRRADGGNGYPAAANFAQMVTSRSAAGPGLIVADAPAMEIERIISQVRIDAQLQWKVAYWIYLAGDLTMDRIATELGCSRQSVYNRLHALHVRVMDDLNQIDIDAFARASANKFRIVS